MRAPVRLWGAGPVLLAALLGCGPHPSGAPKPPPPAVVEKPAKEADLSTVRLSAEAESRLGIKTDPVEQRELPRTRTLGGEVVAPPGAIITLSAPVAGTVRQVSSRPSPGQTLKKGEAILALEPLLPAEARAALLVARVEAEGALEAARAQADAAKISLQRAEQLRRDKAGSQRALDDAKTQHEMAQAALKAAQAKRDLYAGILEGTGAAASQLVTLPIPSPMDGMIMKILAVPGQLVGAGAPLVEVLAAERVWIRVPAYVGDLPEIAVDQEVRVGAPGDPPAAPAETGRPVAAPPSADPISSTVDLYYELTGPDGGADRPAPGKTSGKGLRFTPGQKVAVTLPLRVQEGSLVVPWSSVVYDSQGGEWVYEMVAPRAYVRRRVQVRFVSKGLASLASGPKPGASVVSEGAAELFGTEFGIGK